MCPFTSVRARVRRRDYNVFIKPRTHARQYAGSRLPDARRAHVGRRIGIDNPWHTRT